MSKSLKKLIDINRLREFKNKLVGAGSAYVQTAAVDQTIAGTKTFSKPIVGSVTGSSGSCTGNAATATKLAAKRTIALSGAATGTATSFDGSGNITIPVTSLDASKLTGTASVSTTGNAATATTATTATNATNSNAANQLQAFVNDDFTSGNHYVKAIRSSYGWSTHLWMCYNNGAKMADEVSVNYANSAGSANTANSATTATTAKACTGNAATATKLATARSLWGNNFDGSAAITGKIMGTPAIELMPPEDTSNNGGNLDFHYNRSTADYTSRIIESAYGTLSINDVTITTGKVVTAATFNGALKGNVTGNCSGSSGSCTGNAATATKLATARTIALSGAATGTATGFDGSGNITIPVTALASSAIRAQWYAAYPDGPEAHNSMWGGRDITAAFNNGTVSANIANGTFRDIFPGDYITKQVTIGGTAYTVNWVIADCDYWINKGDTARAAHHVAIVPQQPLFLVRMNGSNTTEGGYEGSAVYKNTIPYCAKGLANAFGSDHILTFRDCVTNSVDTSHVSSGAPFWTGASSGLGWYDAWCNLMSEAMVYGGPHYASSALDNIMATRQMSAFRLSERLINYNRQSWWLRDVVSSTHFAFVNDRGAADAYYASGAYGVRPFALLV